MGLGKLELRKLELCCHNQTLLTILNSIIKVLGKTRVKKFELSISS